MSKEERLMCYIFLAAFLFIVGALWEIKRLEMAAKVQIAKHRYECKN